MARGAINAELFLKLLRVVLQSDSFMIDKEFLSQIDQVDELLLSVPEKLADEILICECFCVSVGDIREACKAQGLVDLDALQARFSLGQGCQSCVKEFHSWSKQIF